MFQNCNLSDFNNIGYLVFQNTIEKKLIEKCRYDLEKIKTFCKEGGYNFFRVYEDYSENINIAGIENIFHQNIISQSVIEVFEKSNVIEIAKRLLKTNEVVLTLSRYHITENISHLGKWHRDGMPGELNSIQLNIYLYDENGFEIVPDSHVNENSVEENKKLNDTPYNKLKNSIDIDSKSCSVLAFHPSFLHRGKSIFPRAHIHLRFKRKIDLEKKLNDNYNLSFLDKFKMSEETKNIISTSLKRKQNLVPYNHRTSFKLFFLRKIKFLLHKFFFFLPYNSIFFKKLNLIPCLKLRKKFGIL